MCHLVPGQTSYSRTANRIRSSRIAMKRDCVTILVYFPQFPVAFVRGLARCRVPTYRTRLACEYVIN